jgi:Ser/Thr protein kinase RdoA (MazF antagonist)
MSSLFPTTYSTLSAKALLAEVVSTYEIDPPLECEFINRGLNDTYLIITPHDRYILRVYRSGWRSHADILYELDVLTHLKEKNVPISTPIARKDGNLVQTLAAPEGERYIVLFTYAPGNELSSEETDHAFIYGQVVARLHTATDEFTSQHQRFGLDLGHLIDNPLQAIQPRLSHRSQDWAYVQTLGLKLRERMAAFPSDVLDRGFCHGDLHIWNARVTEDKILTLFDLGVFKMSCRGEATRCRVGLLRQYLSELPRPYAGRNSFWSHPFDFDCCGVGWRAYDIAVFRWAARFSKKENEQWQAFLKGYQAERSLAEADLQVVPLFIGIRHIWLMGLHTGNGHDWGYGWMNERYFDRALKFLQEWETEYFSGGAPLETEGGGVIPAEAEP